MNEKILTNSTVKDATEQIPDIEFWGDRDTFKLISKASSQNEGWIRSTKALDTGAGCVIQVTTQQRNPDGSYAVAEALTYVPGVTILDLKREGTTVARYIKPTEEAEKIIKASITEEDEF